MKIKLISLFFFTIFCGYFCQSQDSNYVKQPEVPKKKFKNRITIGGNLGLNFGDVTLINLSPRIGYKVTKKLTTGVGVTYQYLQDNRIGQNFKSSIYGGNIFSMYSIIDQAFVQTEFELLNVESRFGYSNRVNVPIWLVGGGYRLSIGGNSFLNFTILYDVIQDSNSPYGNSLIYRGGINIGL